MKNFLPAFFLCLFSIPFVGFGGFMGYKTASMVLLSLETESWLTVPATIENVHLDAQTSKNSTTYRVQATYTYEVNGQRYTGNSVSLTSDRDNVSSFHGEKLAILKSYKNRGEPHPVKVDPHDPTRSVIFPEIRPSLVAFHLTFTLIFGGVGLGIIAFALSMFRSGARESRLQKEYPNQPWMYRDDWRTKKLVFAARTRMIVTSIIALLVNAMTIPALIAIPEEVFVKKNYGMLFILIFNVVGAVLIVLAYRAAAVWKKFGSSTLELAQVPIVPGRKLDGTLIVSDALRTQAQKIQVIVKCLCSYTTGSGKNRTTKTSQLITLSKEFPLVPIPQGSGAQISFDIPQTAQNTSPTGSNPRIHWHLECKADVPGVDFSADFELPVFTTQ